MDDQITSVLAGSANISLLNKLFVELEGKVALKCLISGASGSGKSTLCASLALRLGDRMDVFEVKRNPQADTESKMRALITNFVASRTIMSFLSPQRPKLLIIDDIDVHMRTDRGYASFLTDLVGQDLNANVILTCQSTELGKLPTGMRRKLGKDRIHQMVSPTVEECVAYVVRVESVATESQVRWLSELHCCNVRHVINDIRAGRDVMSGGSEADATHEDDVARVVSAACATTSDILVHIFNADPPMTCMDLVNLGNPSVLVLMHDNLVSELRKGRVKTKEETYRAIVFGAMADALDAASMEAHMECELGVDWDLYECSNIVRCGRTNAAMAQLKQKKRTRESQYATAQEHSPKHPPSLYKKMDVAVMALVPGADKEALFAALMELWAIKDIDSPSGIGDQIVKVLNGVRGVGL